MSATVAAVLVALSGQAVNISAPADAATLAPAPAATEINGLIWRDVNADGVNDASETGFSGVNVQLLDASGNAVRSTTTDAAGLYSFAALAGGPYTVRVPATPTYFEVATGGADQQLTQGSSPTIGNSAPVMPGSSVNGALRPTWVVQLGTWGGGPLSGTTPFATDPASACPTSYAPGDDCSNSDNIVRAQDVTSFLWAVSASNTVASLATPLSNVTLVQRVVPAPGAHISGGALPSACLTTGVLPVSSVTNNADGSVTFICDLGSWSASGTAKLIQWDLNVKASINGSTFTSTTYATSSVAAVSNVATNPTVVANAVPSTTVTDPFVISAGFKYQINKALYQTGTGYYTINGVSTRGRTMTYQFGISSPTKGNEPIAQPVTFTDDMFFTSGNATTPNPAGDIEYYMYNCGANGGGSTQVPQGNWQTNGTGVSSSGTCTLTRQGGNTSAYTVTLNGFDDSGVRYPTKYANGSGDLTNGPYFVGAYSVQIFIPDSSIDTLDGVPGNLAGSGYGYNRMVGFDPVSASGQSSYGSGFEPGYCDPTINPYATNPVVSGCAPMPSNVASDDVVSTGLSISAPWFQGPQSTKYYTNPSDTTWNNGNPGYVILPGETTFQDGAGLREPSQLIQNQINFFYGGEVGYTDPGTCDIFDNTTQTLVPATALYPGAPSGTYAWMSPASFQTTPGYPGSTSSFWTIEYGHYNLPTVDPLYNNAYTATAGVVNSTYYPGVDTYNTTDGRYWGTWSAQQAATNTCRTTAPSGGWFTDPTAVPGGVSAVNAVRIRAHYPNAVSAIYETFSNGQQMLAGLDDSAGNRVWDYDPFNGDDPLTEVSDLSRRRTTPVEGHPWGDGYVSVNL